MFVINRETKKSYKLMGELTLDASDEYPEFIAEAVDEYGQECVVSWSASLQEDGYTVRYLDDFVVEFLLPPPLPT